MPNWVTCEIEFRTKTEKGMEMFHHKMTRPRPHLKEDPERPFRGLPYAEENLEYGEREFSFWNVVRPSKDLLPTYWGEEPKHENLVEALQHKSDHWYDWNIRNWGCKWDAKTIVDDGPSGTVWKIMIDTPWSPPEEFFKELAKQHPNLYMEALCVEEQGWGVVYTAQDGELAVTDEWDIPESHEEFARTSGKYGYACRCVENGDDEEYLYDDCPRTTSKLVDA